MLIAWAAESAQFFIAQGFALAILAWLQTLPEFAVEAVLAWKQQVPLLMANLTGALRLLTGLGWPMIYCDGGVLPPAALQESRCGEIRLRDEHSVEVIGLLASMTWVAVVAWKRSLNLWDAAILIVMYAAYLALLQRMPSEGAEEIEDLEAVPRAIVTAPRGVRIATIAGLFVVGGGLDLPHGGAVPGEPAGHFGRAGGSEFRLRAVGGAVRLGVSREGLGVLLGAHRGARVDGADEHGVEQHQPVDPVGGDAADRILTQPGSAGVDPAGRRAANWSF